MLRFSDLVNNCQAIVRKRSGRPLLVGLGGGECTGKSYLSAQWKKLVGDSGNIFIMPMDGYLLLSRAERASFVPNSTDLTVLAKHIGDHPSSFDHEHLAKDLQDISNNRLWIPRRYDYERGKVVIEKSFCEVPLETVVIVEGLFALCKTLQSVLDVKIFITAPVGLMRQRYIRRYEERKTKTFQEIINTFEQMVLPAYYEFIAPNAENAEYIIHNVSANPTVRELQFSKLRTMRPIGTAPSPRLVKVFITHNLDRTTDFMMNTIRFIAEKENIQIIYSSPGGAAASPSEDVRTKISESDALLAVIGRDTNWVSNEIGMAYAFDLPIYAIYHPENSISGVAKMTTSTRSADIFKPAELEQACENAFTLLKKEITHRYAKLPEIPHPGGAIIRVSWEKWFFRLKDTFDLKRRWTYDPIERSYQASLLSEGRHVHKSVVSRIRSHRLHVCEVGV